ncbi:MAG: AAA family ATPase [Acidimicrobiales bacterium]
MNAHSPGELHRSGDGGGPLAARTEFGTPQSAAEHLERVLFEVKKVIVGQDHMVERLLVSLLARGHILLEGLPGLAKTLAVSTLAQAIGGSFVRLQFTPDLLPSDLIGTRIWRADEQRFDIEWGPVFANLLLTDEINRAPAKVQSALLEVMAERQVSIGGETRPLPRPFLVLATQNPIESEGVYTLPEAQRDRFLMKVTVGYPSPAEELEIVRRMGTSTPHADGVMTLGQLEELQAMADRVYVDVSVAQYAVDVVMATREPSLRGLPELAPLIEFGVSPRASLGLVAAGRAIALLRGRSYVVPQDIFDVARDVLRHRLMLSYEALAKGLSTDDVINRLLSVVPAATARSFTPAANGNGWPSGTGNGSSTPAPTSATSASAGATPSPVSPTDATTPMNLPPLPNQDSFPTPPMPSGDQRMSAPGTSGSDLPAVPAPDTTAGTPADTTWAPSTAPAPNHHTADRATTDPSTPPPPGSPS